MEDSSYYGSYEENERKNPIIKLMIIGGIIIFAIVIIMFFVKIFNKKSTETILLNAAKGYYENNESRLPSAAGECATLTLNYMNEENLIKNSKDFNSCDDGGTYVKVCKLSSGKYQYTPFISCGTTSDTVFDDYKEGKESDLIADKSDVRFSFLAETYSSKEKQYYPKNLKDEESVNELYANSPATGYVYKGAAVTGASKWYKETKGTSYWKKGAYSSTAPAGYPNKGKEGKAVTKISLTAPATTSYRTIKQTTLYRNRVITSEAQRYKYICYSATSRGQVESSTPCESRTNDSYTITINILYSCDGKTTVKKGTVCSATDWSEWSTKSCTKGGTLDCESKTGYVYTDKTWQWYVTGTYRTYYPSGSASASGEQTYYLTSPKAGYVADTTTTTTTYRFYRLVDSPNGGQNEWVKLSQNYGDLEELIKTFKDNNYDVKSLEDINKNEKIRYSIKLEYANRK